MAVQETRQKKNFEPEIWAIPTCSRRSQARIDPFAFNPLAAWEHKRIRFNGNISTVRFISTTDHRIARATLERARARASSYERAAELETFVSCFNGNISTVRFISTTEHRIARATLERARARASSYERAAELGTFVSFFFCLYTKLKHDYNRTTIHDFNLHQ